MATPRFFVEIDLAVTAAGGTIELPEAAAHHATRVMRLAVGDALTLFNGAGGEYAATLVSVDRRGAAARIEAFHALERESTISLTLAQAIASGDAMDYAIRKSVELGVTAIQPIVSARSAPMPEGARGEKRHAHWREIAVSACEQCGRNRIPEIAFARPLGEWLDSWAGGGVVLSPEEGASLATLAMPTKALAVLVGPEGGFTPDENEFAITREFTKVRAGPRILRTETAGVAVLAVMQALWGDWR